MMSTRIIKYLHKITPSLIVSSALVFLICFCLLVDCMFFGLFFLSDFIYKHNLIDTIVFILYISAFGILGGLLISMANVTLTLWNVFKGDK